MTNPRCGLFLVAAAVDNVLDLLGDLDIGGPPAPAPVVSDPFGLGGAVPVAAPQSVTLPVVMTPDRGTGLTVGAALTRQAGQTIYNMQFSNGSAAPVDGFMIQLNTNSFGLQPANQVILFVQL